MGETSMNDQHIQFILYYNDVLHFKIIW